MSEKLHDSKNTLLDQDDALELDDAFFTRATLFDGEKVIRRGRPVSINPKARITIRCSTEVVAAFRATGAGWQTRMDAALKDWLKRHNPADVKI